MKAIIVEPKKSGTARLEDVPEPDAREGSVLVEAVAVGVCGTDVEIVEGKYGWSPPGKTHLVLGHESLGRVVDPGPTGGLKKGDLVVGIVRRPDPVPCPNCAVGEWDMCRNGQYTERGIKQIDGFMSERWRIEPEYTVKVDRSLGLLGVLLEPTTVVEGVGDRSCGRPAPFWEPRTVLVTGAGPIVLWPLPSESSGGWTFTSSIGLSRGQKRSSSALAPLTTPRLSQTLDSRRTSSSNARRRAAQMRLPIRAIGAGGVVCLTELKAAHVPVSTAIVAAEMVLNNVVVGSVNANKRHWYKARSPGPADRSGWRAGDATRAARELHERLQRKPEDIKVVVQFAEA
jgi:hypothetical protein